SGRRAACRGGIGTIPPARLITGLRSQECDAKLWVTILLGTNLRHEGIGTLNKRCAAFRSEQRNVVEVSRCGLVARLVRLGTEAIFLVLICLSPWPFGAVEPVCECLLYTGVAAMLVLAAVDALAGGRGPFPRCPVMLCLAGLILFGVLQLTPLPRP